MKKIKAVITADIVNSTILSSKSLSSLQKSIEKQFEAENIRFSFYRGDSFNALCRAHEAHRISCMLRTMAKQYSGSDKNNEIDIRITIGLGKIEKPVKSLAVAKGEAFLLSGREMDRIGKKGPRLSIRCADPRIDLGMAAISQFTDFILRNMTLRQSQVVYRILCGANQLETADLLGKSQSTISKHASAANWKELSRLMGIYVQLAATIGSNNDYISKDHQ